jgi:RHS repeat-associated protein
VDADRARTGYIGRETDAEHNLGAYGARLYSSEYGRFLAVDKLWEEFRHMSPYAYSENNPVMLKDPTGEFPIETLWDAANVVVDFGRVVYHTIKGNKQKAKEAAVDLAADGAALAIPYLPAGVTKLRHADDVVDAAKTADKAADASKAGTKAADGAEKVGKGSNHTNKTVHVTPDGVALPTGQKYQIPKGYVENPNRKGSYGEILNGKFIEKLRIDPATPAGKKGPAYSHYHIDGKGTHYSPRPGSKDPGFSDKSPKSK